MRSSCETLANAIRQFGSVGVKLTRGHVASGFIILRDGRCLSVRHATHDTLLPSVAASMEECSPLRRWLLSLVTRELDINLGYAFVRATDGEPLTRDLDLGGVTEANRRLFEEAARKAEPIAGPFAPVEDVTFALQRLRTMLDRCDSGEPPLELSDWTREAPPVEGRVGPEWEESVSQKCT